MHSSLRRFSVFALVLTACALIGAGCGSSQPKISESGYIDKCVTELKKNDKLKNISEDKIKSVCVCTQKELVAKGFGDRKTDDSGDDLQKAGTAAGAKCAAQVLLNRGY